MYFFYKLWDRINQNRHVRKITGSNVTAIYAIMSISYCSIQLLVLVTAWAVNHSAGSELESLLHQSGFETRSDFVYLETTNAGKRLRLCTEGITNSSPISRCDVVFPVENVDEPITAPDTQAVTAISQDKRDGVTMVPVFIGDNLTSVMIYDSADPENVVAVPPACVQALEWPYQTLIQTRRVDVTVACYQAWLLIMSAVAVFTQSIPHIASSFIVHIIAVIWSSSQIYSTVTFRSDYQQLITGPNGACSGVDLIGDYFQIRIGYEIATTVINVVTLILSAYLTWRLISLYGWATFKKMGASIAINRAYKIALALSVVIQLDIFFYVASVGIWLDEITKHIMGAQPILIKLYLGLYISATICVIPWLYLAWYGIRRESKRLMYAFFFLSVVFLAGSGGMFKSDTFRQTFLYWPFFSAMFSISYVLMVLTIILAVLCLRNFNIGLPHYFERRNGGDFKDGLHPTPGIPDDDVEKLALPLGDEFVIKFPGEDALANIPKRSNSLSSTSSTESAHSQSRPSGRTSRVPITAAEPGAVKITTPSPTASRSGRNLTLKTSIKSLKSSTSASPTTKPSWKVGDDKHMWGKAKRHDSEMSFGHLDATKFSRQSSMHRSELQVLSRETSAVTRSGTAVSAAPSSNYIVPPGLGSNRSLMATTTISREPTAGSATPSSPERSLDRTLRMSVNSVGSTYSSQSPPQKLRLHIVS